MLEIHLTGKATKKRQKFDSSTPPAQAYHSYFTLNGETRRAPTLPPDSSFQAAWEEADHKVSQVSPRPTPPKEKRKKKLNNKQ
jgi:galactose mutarotase-like enzyme